MIFGRSSGKQSQNGQGAAEQGQQTAQPYGEQTNGTPWQTAGGAPLAGGYPKQQAGTGYAGYTPGSGGNAYGSYGAAGNMAGQNGSGAVYGGQGTGGYGVPYGTQGANVAGGYAAGRFGGAGYGAAAGAYGQTGQNYGGQSAGGYAAGGQGYAQGSAGYAPGGQSAGGYAAGGQSYAQGSAGYAPGGQNAGGYAAGGQGYAQGSYGYVPGGQNAGGYAAGGQNYAPQGYPAGGGYSYPQMNGGQGGYNSGYNSGYAQMGRNQPGVQQPSQQIPLNGGGYVPEQVPVRKQPFVFNTGLLILISAVLLVLFAVGLFVPDLSALLWIFLVLAAGSIAFFWVKPLISGNRRLCYTIIFGVLSLVALLSVTGLLAGMRSSRPAAPAGTDQPATVNVGTAVSSGNASGGSGQQAGTAGSVPVQAEPAATPTPAADTGATDRLEAFFRYWSANMQDEMLTLCAPSWQSGVDNPKTALFGLLANRKPLDYTVENITGTSESTSRTVTVTSTIDRNNGKDPVKYRLSVLMVKEGDQWYVDPQSLKTYENAETPDPATVATATPTAEPAASASTVLYYNPDGGTKYHLDQNCKSTHAKYLPMKGHFTYGEINDDKYKNLSPCNVCAAPLRP